MAYPLAERPERPKRKPSEYDDKPIGTQFADEAEKALEWTTSLPVVRPVLQTVGGALRVGYEKIIEPMKYESEQLLAGREADIPSAVVGSAVRAFEFGTKTGEVLGAEAAEALNVDPRIGSFLGGGVAETVMTAGVGTVAKKAVKAIDMMTPPGAGGLTPALAGGGGGLKLNFKPRVDVPETPQVMPLTVTKPERIAKDVVEGIAESPQFAKQVSRWEERWKTAHSRLDKWLAETEAPPKVIARNIKKSTAEAYGSVSTGMARLEDMFDEYFYKRMASEGKERHHLFPKAESYQFVKRLKQMIDDNVADMDDMVNLFLYAEDAGTVMGNRKANMLLMEKIKEHGPLHRMRETTEGALGLKMEPKTEDLFAKLSEAKNADELMDMFDEYLKLNIKPSKRAAFEQTMKKEREFLNVMKPTLSESQRRRL